MNLDGKIKKTQALSGRLVKSSGGGGSVQEIYWVQYGVGTATNAEVNTAIAANKLPICYWDSTNASGQTTRRPYYLIRHTPTEALFATVDSTNETILVRRLYADAWNTQTIRYEGKLTWDQTPRFGSVNPVTSGGIYQAIQDATVSDERIQDAVDDWLDDHAASIDGLSFAAKQAIMDCFAHVAWVDEHGQQYYDALYNALFEGVTLESITAVFTQGSAVIYDDDALDILKQYLTVTATYSDSTTAVVTDYTLSGTLNAGTSTITVSYGGKTDTFTVTVTKYWDIEWDYTQGTPIGKGFAHSSAVVGSMAEEGYRLEGTSSGGCNLITDPTTTADIGVSEITIKFNQIYPSMIGFHFDVNGLWAAIINNNKLGYKITANNPGAWSASDVVQVQNIAINTGVEYTFRLEWNTASGATLRLNGEQMYSINSALTQANRTRWLISAPSDCVVIVKSMRVKVVS